MPVGDEPLTFVDHLANSIGESFDFAVSQLNEQFGKDVKVENLIVMLAISGGPEGEPDSTVAAFGVAGPQDAFEIALTHVIAAGREIGIQVGLMPMRPPGDN